MIHRNGVSAANKPATHQTPPGPVWPILFAGTPQQRRHGRHLAGDRRAPKTLRLRRMHERLRWNWLAAALCARRRILAKIGDHDRIISYVEHGKLAQLYLLMDYVEASNLKELYAQHDPVWWRTWRRSSLIWRGPRTHARERLHAPRLQARERTGNRNASVRLVDLTSPGRFPRSRRSLREEPGTPPTWPRTIARRTHRPSGRHLAYGVAAYELLTNRNPSGRHPANPGQAA